MGNNDSSEAASAPARVSYGAVLGYDRHCGGLVVVGNRGSIATCQGCGLFSSTLWWSNGELTTRSDRKTASGAQDRIHGALGERVTRNANTISPDGRARISAAKRAWGAQQLAQRDQEASA